MTFTVLPVATCVNLLLYFLITVECNHPSLMLFKKTVSPVELDYILPFCSAKNTNQNDRIDGILRDGNTYAKFWACPASRELIDKSPEFPKANYCLIPHATEMQNCKQEVLPTFIEKRKCGKDFDNKLYSFGYHVCPLHDGLLGGPVDLEIFEFCFNFEFENHRTVYVDYKIISPSLFNDDENVDNDEDFHSNIKRSELVDSIDGNDEVQIDESTIDTFLVPKSHMAFDLWKKALNYDVNVRGLDHTLTKFMDNLNEYLKNLAIERLGEIRIVAGVFDSKIINESDHIWWKLVYDEGEHSAIAFIIHTESVSKKLCTSICEEFGWTGWISNEDVKFAYCCSPEVITDVIAFKRVPVFHLKDGAKSKYFEIASKCKVM